ncbi:right-handed parallel beta-helix repeat-containing protein [Flavihumibacter sp. ZG627]|uniref:right-handed parallel beta-helix repeat-containing protein n=1 Tax=Flavihumibacter sp. ZG627 TaxID=1463156 RepID=UPI0005807D2E|nr:right-handed parallel beta-helix repeat-containing protein [Flavihumibacter sp. ZG627]KIC91925.1 hypothetical protein HY58_06870 [Flavihumibacter sp. ZG627]
MKYLVIAFLFLSCTKQVTKTTETKEPVSPVNPQLPVYYISADGNTTNSGRTPDKPWSISRANNHDFSAGDILEINGKIDEVLYIGREDAGETGAPLTIQGSGTLKGIDLYNTENITIKQLRFVGEGIMIHQDQQSKEYLSNFIVDSVESSEAMWGLKIHTSGKGFENVSITNSVFHHNRHSGIYTIGNWPEINHRNIHIKNVIAHHNSGTGETNTGHGIVVAGFNGGVIEYSEAYENGSNGDANIGIWAFDAIDITIQYCKSHHNRSKKVDGGGFDLDGGAQQCVIQYCQSWENDGEGFLLFDYGGPNPTKNNTFQYNISYNDARKNTNYGGFTLGGVNPVYNTRLYNNTVYISKGAGVNNGALTFIYGAAMKGLEVKNNIFYADGLGITAYYDSPATMELANNLYYSTKAISLAGLVGDPLFSENLYLTQSSPAVNKGIELDGLPKKDIYNNAITNQRDIGAIESH